MKQTEPIGFKGSKGTFILTKHPGSFVIHTLDNTTIGDVWQDDHSIDEKYADAKIMAASKKMAIALQPFSEWAKECLNNPNLDNDQVVYAYNKAEIKMQDLRNVLQALKEAGL